MAESPMETGRPLRQLLVVAAIIVFGYACIQTLRFTVGSLNSIFVCVWLLVPFLAIRPVFRLRRWPRICGLVLLTPLLLLSSLLLVGKVVFDGFLGFSERAQALQTFQLGSSTIQLQDYENGGAVGVHGLNLEQRRLIVPGLFVVRSVDFFDDAREGTLFVEGPYRVRVHARGNYYNNDYEVDRDYTLKPWVYF
jgi:hypothetical protein